MSLYGALMTGVSGLNANSKALSIASSNIANVNTIGYKTSEASFSTLLASSVRAGDVGSSGVTAFSAQNVSQQGLLASTNSSTDLAISGNGFFVVSKTPDTATSTAQYYTRAGDFRPDASGNLRNSSGYYLLGWELDANGAVPSDRNALVPVNVSALAGKATPTSTMAFKANLQATADVNSTYTTGDMYAGNVTPDFQRTVNVYDSQGGTQPIQLSFVKTGANTWSYEVTYQGDAANIGGTANNPIYSGTMSFNEDGTLANADTSITPATGSLSITIPWASSSGLAPQSFNLDLGTVGTSSGLTQFSSASTLISSQVDGALYGSISGVSIDNEGYVTAQFSNGLSQRVYKVPVALFSNPDGLTASSGNAFSASESSGNATISEAATGSAGGINASALESSTVDLAHEFTNLITTQRAYSASARIITTASEMLDQLLQMGR